MSSDDSPYSHPGQPAGTSASGSQSSLPGASPYPEPSVSTLPKESLTSIPREGMPLLPEGAQSPAALGNSPLSKEAGYDSGYDRASARRPFYKKPVFWFLSAVGLVIVVLAVVLPVYFVVIKPKNDSDVKGGVSSGGGGGGGNSGGTTPGGTTNPTSAIQIGGDGSKVTTEDGSTFTYKNSFGGYWVTNSEDPFDNSARPNSWTPPLNESWDWNKDRIYGVNIGGLFVLEPFIVPSLYEQNPGAVDEWTLSTILAGKGQLQDVLEKHYDTFITEEDLAQIAGAGLNWIRVPIPFWAIETWSNIGVDENGDTISEPFLARVCWKYILRLLGWARKYGLRVLLDLHTIPGSQNGYNHSGKLGSVNWLNGPMGIANAERSLDYIRIITEFISQPEYKDLIPAFGILNEPFVNTIGRDALESFYLRAYQMVRDITGTGAGNGPMISLHTGFAPLSTWADFLPGADRVIIDDHPYFAFDGQQNREPLNVTADGSDGSLMGGQWPQQACNGWGVAHNNSRKNFGVTIAGEFSNAINDCGLFVNGVNGKPRYGDGCDYWEDSASWSDATVQGLHTFMLASMDALGDYFFWTWKIGESTTTNTVRAPLWSYKLGLAGGWMPADPRAAVGTCAQLGARLSPFAGPFQAWQTGGEGAGTLAPAATAGIAPWPPAAAISHVPGGVDPDTLPQYTSTGTVVTLPPPTLAPSATASAGNGWANAKDTAPAVTTIPGCAYPDAWDALNAQVPLSGCQPAPTA